MTVTATNPFESILKAADEDHAARQEKENETEARQREMEQEAHGERAKGLKTLMRWLDVPEGGYAILAYSDKEWPQAEIEIEGETWEIHLAEWETHPGQGEGIVEPEYEFEFMINWIVPPAWREYIASLPSPHDIGDGQLRHLLYDWANCTPWRSLGSAKLASNFRRRGVQLEMTFSKQAELRTFTGLAVQGILKTRGLMLELYPQIKERGDAWQQKVKEQQDLSAYSIAEETARDNYRIRAVLLEILQEMIDDA